MDRILVLRGRIPTEFMDSSMTKYFAPFAWGESLEVFYVEKNFLVVPLPNTKFID